MDPDDPPVASPAEPAEIPRGFDLTNLRLVAGLTGVDRTLFNLGVYPAGGVGHRYSARSSADLDPVTAAVEIVRAQVMRNNVDLVMGVVRPLHSTTGALEIVVDSRVAASPTLEQLLRGDDAALAAVEALRAQGTVITVTPRPAPTIRRIGEIDAALAGIRDAQGEVISLLSSPDLPAGAVRVCTATEHVEVVRRAVAAFGTDVLVEGDDQFIVLE
jgi:hypothetical protein